MFKILAMVALISISAIPSEAQNRDRDDRGRTWPPVYPEARDHRNDIIWSVPRPGGGYVYFGGGKQLQTCQPSSIGGQICH